MSKNINKDDFINEPNRVTHRVSRKNPSRKDILLMITGKKSNEIRSIRKVMYFKEEIFNDIEKYCSGSFTPIVNYLIRRGLDDVIKQGIKVFDEA
jgi:hypothetical protein